VSNQASAHSFHRGEKDGKIVVIRSHFAKLLSLNMSLRDRLLIELPTLEAFRTGEVSSLKAEYIDFERGDLRVLDSKKHKLFTVPLDPVLAVDLEKYMVERNITEGYLFKPRRKRKVGNKSVGASLTDWAIICTWAKWCAAAGIPRMNPRMGRAYFAVIEHYVLGKPLAYVQFMLRHDDLQSTEHYVCSRIVSYEDQKTLFLQSKRSPFASECTRSALCPNAIEGCHCRFFTPRVETIEPVLQATQTSLRRA